MGSLGRNIARRRIELGMTQDELALKLGYKTRSSINKIEKGNNDVPHRKLAEFAKALETTVAVLIGADVEQKAAPVQETTKVAKSVAEDTMANLVNNTSFTVNFDGNMNQQVVLSVLLELAARIVRNEAS